MSSDTPARHERAALADALAEAGPDAPTLCEGWDARRLLGHLISRERRPDAGPGIVLPGPFADWTDKVERGYAERDFAEMIEQFRNGPPTFSVFAIPGVDAKANLGEYFVHCEDVRRPAGLEPRELPTEVDDALWAALPRLAKMMLRKEQKFTVHLRTPDGERSATVGDSGAEVTLIGDPGELMLYLFGRGAAADVELEGDEQSVARFRAVELGL